MKVRRGVRVRVCTYICIYLQLQLYSNNYNLVKMFLCSDIKLFLLISYDITQLMISDTSRSQSGFLSILKLTSCNIVDWWYRCQIFPVLPCAHTHLTND